MKILLVNFLESPENLHFEQAFIRALKGGDRISLDIVHDFQFPCPFIEKLPPPRGRRIKYTNPAALKRELRSSYDILVLLDFPKRKACADPFLRLLRSPACAKKIFIANHLFPMPGHNPTADIAGKLGLLSVLDQAFILEFDDPDLWSGLGLKSDRILKRGYAVDCLYYGPAGLKEAIKSGEHVARGNGVFSAGSTGRDFSVLASAVKKAGLTLNIFSDAEVPPFKADLRGLASVFPLSKNLHNLRQAVREARAVVIPIADGHVNEAAGNSIAFISMACGRPVIVKRTPYMERFIKDGENGFFYGSLSAPNLLRQLNRVLSLAPAALHRLGEEARAAILEKASLDAFAAAFAAKFILKK